MSALSSAQVQQLAPAAAVAVFQGLVPQIPSQPPRTASASLTDLAAALTAIDAALDAAGGSAAPMVALYAAIPAPCSALPQAQQTILVVLTLLKRAGLI